MTAPTQTGTLSGILVRSARLPGMRALAWNGNVLYASRGYDLLRARMDLPHPMNWQLAGRYRPSWNRRLSVAHRLSARLFRDGFHALAVLPSGQLIAAVPGAIVALHSGDSEFRQTFKIMRGTRPLHITAVPDGTVFWGEYFDNASREETHIYASTDAGLTWHIAHSFHKRAIRHIHNIVHDPWQDCLWILTGDYGDECRILRAKCDLSTVEVILQGNQQARAVAALPLEDGLYFASDTPLQQNFIYRLDRQGTLSQLTPITSSSIYGCRVGEHLFFSTMVEPSGVNRSNTVRVYGARVSDSARWDALLSWTKDRWPMKFFQYGNAFFPDGNNTTTCLALTTIAVETDDLVTSVYSATP